MSVMVGSGHLAQRGEPLAGRPADHEIDIVRKILLSYVLNSSDKHVVSEVLLVSVANGSSSSTAKAETKRNFLSDAWRNPCASPPAPENKSTKRTSRTLAIVLRCLCQGVKPACKSGWVKRLALPYSDNLPAQSSELSSCVQVSTSVHFNLSLPKGRIRAWHGGATAPTMSMPEATVDENNRPPFRQHDIR